MNAMSHKNLTNVTSLFNFIAAENFRHRVAHSLLDRRFDKMEPVPVFNMSPVIDGDSAGNLVEHG